MSKPTDTDLIAAFLAKKAPTVCETGAKALNRSDRQWYRALRDDGRTERQWEKKS